MLRSFTFRGFGIFGLVAGVSVFLSGCSASVPNVEGVVGSEPPVLPEPRVLSAYEQYELELSEIAGRARLRSTAPLDAIPTEGEMIYSGVATVQNYRINEVAQGGDLIDALGAVDATVNFETGKVGARIFDLVTKSGDQVSGEIIADAQGGLGITHYSNEPENTIFITGSTTGSLSWADQSARVSGAGIEGYFRGPNAEELHGNLSGGRLTLDDGTWEYLTTRIHVER